MFHSSISQGDELLDCRLAYFFERELLSRLAATGPPLGGSRIGQEGVRFPGWPRPDRHWAAQGSSGRGAGGGRAEERLTF